MKLALVTYFYNQGIKYIDGFIDTIKKQSFQDFKLIVFNDGVLNAKDYFVNYTGQIEFVDVSGTPTEVRFQSFKFLVASEFEYIIFQDIDDEMSSNRVEVLSDLLIDHQIVSNDLSLMNEVGLVYKQSIWSDKLTNRSVVDDQFIKDKNIVGIGNSGIQKSVLNTPITYSSLPKVADWFIFYQLMNLGKTKAIFTTECQTFYRQHENNMAGVRDLDEARLSYVIEVKKAHYLGLEEIGFDMKKELMEIQILEQLIGNIVKTNAPRENLFWWEETNDLVIN